MSDAFHSCVEGRAPPCRANVGVQAAMTAMTIRSVALLCMADIIHISTQQAATGRSVTSSASRTPSVDWASGSFGTFEFLAGKQQPAQYWSSVNHLKGALDIFLRCFRRPRNPDGLHDLTRLGTRGTIAALSLRVADAIVARIRDGRQVMADRERPAEVPARV